MLYALAITLPLLFAVIIWQLILLDPVGYCNIVKSQGIPPGDHCFKLLMEGLKIKGWVIWLLIGMMASFILIVLISLVKGMVSIVGPGGLGLKIFSHEGPTPNDTGIMPAAGYSGGNPYDQLDPAMGSPSYEGDGNVRSG